MEPNHPLSTLQDIQDALDFLGKRSELNADADAITLRIGGSENPIIVALTIDDAGEHLSIDCQVALLGQIPEPNQPSFALRAMDQNSLIRPFSFALLSDLDGEGDDDEQFPVVLTNSVPLGHFTVAELDKAVGSLQRALAMSADTIRDALTPETAEASA